MLTTRSRSSRPNTSASATALDVCRLRDGGRFYRHGRRCIGPAQIRRTGLRMRSSAPSLGGGVLLSWRRLDGLSRRSRPPAIAARRRGPWPEARMGSGTLSPGSRSARQFLVGRPIAMDIDGATPGRPTLCRRRRRRRKAQKQATGVRLPAPPPRGPAGNGPDHRYTARPVAPAVRLRCPPEAEERPAGSLPDAPGHHGWCAPVRDVADNRPRPAAARRTA